MAEAENNRTDRNQENKRGNRSKKEVDKDHVIRKRQPPRLPKRPNDIYVTNRSNFQVN